MITDAQLLHPIILGKVCRLAIEAGTDLWLIHQPPISDHVFKSIQRLSDRTAELDEVPTAKPEPTIPHSDAIDSADRRSPVPLVDFPFFIASLRELPIESARSIHEIFADQFDRSSIAIQGAADQVRATSSEVVSLISLALGDDELIARLRALQVAAWQCDIFVNIDLKTLLMSEDRPRISPERADELLMGYRQPHRAIVVALTVRQIGIDDIVKTPISSTDSEGNIYDDGTPISSSVALRRPAT